MYSIEIRTFRTKRNNYAAFVSIDECQDDARDMTPVDEEIFFGYTEEEARARAIEYAEVGGIAEVEAHECVLDWEIKERFGSIDFIDEIEEGDYKWYLR